MKTICLIYIILLFIVLPLTAQEYTIIHAGHSLIIPGKLLPITLIFFQKPLIHSQHD